MVIEAMLRQDDTKADGHANAVQGFAVSLQH